MEIVYFTIAGIFLYLFSDWLLDRIEMRFGRRFEHRSLIFFVIILVLSMGLFNLIQYLQGGHSAPNARDSGTEIGINADSPSDR
ncbi:MAG TPA: hypothetical protein ENJ43_05365 [Gammaproteobacteria bacterium]|nr:hypothetical protein [Gammaproteobacteria bacterium]